MYRHEHASNIVRYRFPYVGADLRYLAVNHTPAYTARPRVRASDVSHGVPVYFPSFHRVLIVPIHGAMAQVGCLVLRRGGHPSRH